MAEIVIRKTPPAKGESWIYFINLFPPLETEAGSFGTPFTSARQALERYNFLVGQGNTLSQNAFDNEAWGDQNAALQTLIADAAAEEAAETQTE